MLWVAFLTFCCLETISRTLLFKHSKDFSSFAQLPRHARELTAQPGLHIALIGNSTTDDCTDISVIKHELEQKLHEPVYVDAV